VLDLLLDQGLKLIAAQFARWVGLAVDDRSLGSQHLHWVPMILWVAPFEVRADCAVAVEDALGIRALVARGDVDAERLRRRPTASAKLP